MKIGGRELGLGSGGGRRLNKVSISTITTTVPAKTRVVGLGVGGAAVKGIGVREVVGKEAEVRIVRELGVGVTPDASRVRVLEEPVAAVEVPETEEFMEEGLTSPW